MFACKLLGIVGSPRPGGNTELIMQEALKVGKQQGAETELIRLVEYELEPCDGCGTCYETKNCIINDDVEKIFEKMAESDGIIIGSPVYVGGISAQTKTFIDRISYLNSARGKKAFMNKIGGAIAVAGRAGSTTAICQILLFLTTIRMIRAWPTVTAIATAKGDVIRDKHGVERARELGKSMFRIANATVSLRGDEPQMQLESLGAEKSGGAV